MKSKMKYIPILIAIIGIIFNRIAVACVNADFCSFSNILWPIFYTVIKPLYLFSLIFVIIGVILVFVQNNIFKSWLRFAMWWLPLSVILIAITPETSNSWMPLYFIGKGTVTVLMAGIFTIISLILIAWKTFATKKV